MDWSFIFHNTDWAYGAVVFGARVVDVSLGTLRTIAIVQGRTMMAFWFGFIEAAVWLAVVSTIVQTVGQQPLLGLVYSFGYATGNIVGIKVEKFLAMGHQIIRIISRKNSQTIATTIRDKGYPVTTFAGEGKSGPVTELYVVCRRKDLKKMLRTILALDPEAFYVTEQANSVSNACLPLMQPVSRWQALMKKNRFTPSVANSQLQNP